MKLEMMRLVHDVAILFPTFLVVFTFRGFVKAFIAWMFGDDTAYQSGFLTLNPLAHVAVLDLLLILLVLFFIGGLFSGVVSRMVFYLFLIAMSAHWTIPVPINELNFRHQVSGLVAVTFSGPLGSFLLALLFLYVGKYVPFELLASNIATPLARICYSIIELALFFGILDLIPLPPFDMGYLLITLLPARHQRIAFWLERNAIYIFLVLFFFPGISDVFFGFIFSLRFFIEQLLLLLVW